MEVGLCIGLDKFRRENGVAESGIFFREIQQGFAKFLAGLRAEAGCNGNDMGRNGALLCEDVEARFLLRREMLVLKY